MAAKKNESEHIFVRRVLIVLGLATLFFLVWQLRMLLLMLFGAIVVASIFRAVADLLVKYARLSTPSPPVYPSCSSLARSPP